MSKTIYFKNSSNRYNESNYNKIFNWLKDNYEFRYNFKFNDIDYRKKESRDEFLMCDYDKIYHEISILNFKGVSILTIKGIIKYISKTQKSTYVEKI